MARKPDDWMPLVIGKYLANTTHLTRDQHGAYLLLSMSYWTNGGPLDADDEGLAAITKSTLAEWRKLRRVLVKFFEEHDGKWHHGFLDEKLKEAREYTERKAQAGARGAAKRWQIDSTAMAEPSVCHKQTDAPLPSSKPVSSEAKASSEESASPQAAAPPKLQKVSHSKPKKDTEPEGFVGFYEHYPRKEARRDAAKSYASALARGSPAEILEGVKRYAEHVRDWEQKFIKLPATWLNKDCWKDQYEARKNGRNDKPERSTKLGKILAGMSATASDIDAERRERDTDFGTPRRIGSDFSATGTLGK